MRFTSLTAALVAACLLAGCASADDSAAEHTNPTTTTGSGPKPSPETTTSPAESALEGTWTTDLRRDAVVTYIRNAGWGRKAERVLLDPQMAGPEQTEFRLDFVGDRFRMSQAATDEQWQSGTWWIEDGRLYLDDEGPEGELTFRVDIDGDTATFDDPGTTDTSPEYLPGVPNWAFGAVLWAVTPWSRSVESADN